LTVLPQAEAKESTYTYVCSLSWPPLEAALSIINVIFVVKGIIFEKE